MRSRRARASRSIPCTATRRISRRRASGSAKRGSDQLARSGFLALHATLGALEQVANARHGLDDVARAAVGAELATEPAHVQLHEVTADVGVVTPDPLEDLLLGEHAAGVRHEVTEELELGR